MGSETTVVAKHVVRHLQKIGQCPAGQCRVRDRLEDGTIGSARELDATLGQSRLSWSIGLAKNADPRVGFLGPSRLALARRITPEF